MLQASDSMSYNDSEELDQLQLETAELRQEIRKLKVGVCPLVSDALRPTSLKKGKRRMLARWLESMANMPGRWRGELEMFSSPTEL